MTACGPHSVPAAFLTSRGCLLPGTNVRYNRDLVPLHLRPPSWQPSVLRGPVSVRLVFWVPHVRSYRVCLPVSDSLRVVPPARTLPRHVQCVRGCTPQFSAAHWPPGAAREHAAGPCTFTLTSPRLRNGLRERTWAHAHSPSAHRGGLSTCQGGPRDVRAWTASLGQVCSFCKATPLWALRLGLCGVGAWPWMKCHRDVDVCGAWWGGGEGARGLGTEWLLGSSRGAAGTGTLFEEGRPRVPPCLASGKVPASLRAVCDRHGPPQTRPAWGPRRLPHLGRGQQEKVRKQGLVASQPGVGLRAVLQG